jgi:hypothetical protein
MARLSKHGCALFLQFSVSEPVGLAKSVVAVAVLVNASKLNPDSPSRLRVERQRQLIADFMGRCLAFEFCFMMIYLADEWASARALSPDPARARCSPASQADSRAVSGSVIGRRWDLMNRLRLPPACRMRSSGGLGQS